MGTKLQNKSYLPGYYSMRDLNDDANTSSWQLFYNDRILNNGQCFNIFTSTNGYSDYDKEILKQTMLRQEAIFRNQVYELHRLYKVQRDLMSEFQKKEFYKHPIPIVTPQSNPFSSHIRSEDAQKIWQKPVSPIMRLSCCGSSMSATDDRRSQLNFLKEIGTPLCVSQTQNGWVNDCKILDPKHKKFPKPLFDLELPADEYIDSEEGEENHEENVGEVLPQMYSLQGGSSPRPKDGVKLTLGKQDEWKSHLREQIHCLADLNEPVREMGIEETEDPASIKLLGPMVHHEDRQGKQQGLNILGQTRDFFQDNNNYRDHKSILHAETQGARPEWMSYILEPGMSKATTKPSTAPVFFQEKSTPLSKPIQIGLKKTPEISSFLSSNQKESWFTEKSTSGVQFSNTSLSNNSRSKAHPVLGTFSNIPHTDDANASSSWKKPTNGITHIPAAVQALPCFKKCTSNKLSKTSNSAVQSPSVRAEKWDLNSSSLSHSSFGSDESCPNGFNHKPRLDHVTGCIKANQENGDYSVYEQTEGRGHAKSFKGLQYTGVMSNKDMNLNMCLPNGSFDTVTSEDDPMFIDGEGTQRDQLSCLSLFRKELEIQQIKSGSLTEAGASQGLVQKSSVSLQSKEPELLGLEVTGTSSVKKVFGFTLPDIPQNSKYPCHFSFSSLPLPNLYETGAIEHNVKDGLSNIDCNHTLPELENQLFASNTGPSPGLGSLPHSKFNDINLNADVTACKNKKNPLDISSKIDEEVPVSSSVTRAATEVPAQIDLEVPLVGEIVPVEEEFLETNQFVAPEDTGDPCEELAIAAAKAIVTFSSATCHNSSKDNNYCPSPSAIRDSLSWFAEVISSKANDLERMTSPAKTKVGADQESSEEGLDYFEAMTLKLNEINVDEYCSKSWEQENPDDEEMGLTPLLPRSRRGHRRGRQRRDFQKDVLPSLASLARHEVTKDLQTIGELMKASSCSMQVELTRRSARNGWNCLARGRRRLRDVNVVEAPQPRHPSVKEVELEGINLQGWGKTTRRARRQRYPQGNVAALLT